MGALLSRLFADAGGGVPGPSSDFWYGPVNTPGPAGMRVDVEQAKKISAWYRGRDILATVLAMLPLGIYERLPHDGGADLARQHPLFDLLHAKPNAWQDSFQWRRQKMYHLIDHGNGYDWIVPGARGFVDALPPIAPTRVTPEQVSSGRILYYVRDPKTGRTTTHTQDEIFHLRGSSDDGVVGQGILAVARASLGTALATEAYAGGIFGSGTLNGGVIETLGVLDDDASRRMAKSFVTRVGEWHLPKVLEQGATWKPDTMTPEDAQMLLSRKFTVDDIARWLGVPRQMLENNDPSFGNAEQFDDNFLTYSLGPWLSLFEFAINDQLILQPARYYAEFTRDAVVRGKFLERAQGNVALVNAGIVTADEVRVKEGKNKRGGKADELRDPQNITGKPSADATPPPTPAPTPRPTPPKAEASDTRVRAIVIESAARLVRKETLAAQRAAVKYAGDADGWAVWATDFYEGHVALVAQSLVLADAAAWLYCDSQRDDLIAQGLVASETWTTDYLVGLALDAPRADPWQTLAELQARQSHTTTVHGGPVTIEKGAITSSVAPAAVTVHAPVTIDDGAIRVEAPVTIQKGAIAHTTQVAAAPARTMLVDKQVSRGADGQVTRVREEHREKD